MYLEKMAKLPRKKTESEAPIKEIPEPDAPKQKESMEIRSQAVVKKGVRIPLKIKLKHQWQKHIVQPFQKYFHWIEAIFLIACIFTVCVFLGATNSWLTLLFSISAYFMWQELYGQTIEIASRLGKR